MATLTSTAMASSPRAVHAGVNSITVNYNSGSTAISASATTILMCKVPDKATILDIIEHHTSGAATCPTDYGVQGADLSAFASQLTTGSVARATKGVPYDVSVSASNATKYKVVTATVTPGTTTASVKVNLTVLYTMDR